MVIGRILGRLQQEFAGPNAELESLTGADLSAWAGDGRATVSDGR